MVDHERAYLPQEYDRSELREAAISRRQLFDSTALYQGLLALLFGYSMVLAIILQIFSIQVTSSSINIPQYQGVLLAIALSSLGAFMIRSVLRAEALSMEIPYDPEHVDFESLPRRLKILLFVLLPALSVVAGYFALDLHQAISGVDLLNSLFRALRGEQVLSFLVSTSILIGVSGAVTVSLSSLALFFLSFIYDFLMRIYVLTIRLRVLLAFQTLRLPEEELQKRCSQCYSKQYEAYEQEDRTSLYCQKCGLEKEACSE
jgi:hypothetical protein